MDKKFFPLWWIMYWGIGVFHGDCFLSKGFSFFLGQSLIGMCLKVFFGWLINGFGTKMCHLVALKVKMRNLSKICKEVICKVSVR